MNFISKDFRIQHLSYYQLLIYAGHQEDVLLIIDQEQTVQAYLRYPSSSPTLEATRLLALPFAKVFIVIPQHSVTFVPAEVYQQEDEALYEEYLVNKNDEDVYTVNVANFGLQAVYQFDSLLYKRWKTLFPDALYAPLFQVFFDLVPQDLRLGAQIILHQTDDQMHLVIVQNGQFVFYNQFLVDNATDLGYYVRRVMQDFEIESFESILLSNIALEDDLLRFIKSFSARIEYLKIKNQQNAAESTDLPSGLFASIFQRELCV